MADFVRDPEWLSAAAICYVRFELFGSPSANCVIPLAALASLPPSISLWLKNLDRGASSY